MTTRYIINYFIFLTFRNHCTTCTCVRIINVKIAFAVTLTLTITVIAYCLTLNFSLLTNQR